MRVLLFGSTGKVGRELRKQLTASHHEVVCPTRDDCDLKYHDVGSYVRQVAPKIVVNAAAFNGMEACANSPRDAYLINAIAPALMAEACKALGIPILHLSTDYVFDGRINSIINSARLYTEDMQPMPENIYSRSKLLGETGVWRTAAKYIIVRLSTIYDDTLTGPLSPLQQQNESAPFIKTFEQVCCPTSASLIARGLVAAINYNNVSSMKQYGTFHFSTKNALSREDFANYILKSFFPNRSFDIRNIELSLPRPKFSVMNVSDFEHAFYFDIPTVTEDFCNNMGKFKGLVRCQQVQ